MQTVSMSSLSSIEALSINNGRANPSSNSNSPIGSKDIPKAFDSVGLSVTVVKERCSSGPIDEMSSSNCLTDESKSSLHLIGNFHDDIMHDLNAEMDRLLWKKSGERDAAKVQNEGTRECSNNLINQKGTSLTNGIQETEQEMKVLKRISGNTAALREKLDEIVGKAVEERSKQQKRINEERQRLEEMELRHRETGQQMWSSSNGSDQQQNDLVTQYKTEQLDLEQHRKLLDDLEFQLLEFESQYEEQKEVVQQKFMDDQRQLTEIYNQHQLLRQNGRKDRTNEEYINPLKQELSSSLATPNGRLLSDPITKAAQLRLTFLEVQANDVIEEQKKRLEQLRTKASIDAHLSWTRRQASTSSESPGNSDCPDPRPPGPTSEAGGSSSAVGRCPVPPATELGSVESSASVRQPQQTTEQVVAESETNSEDSSSSNSDQTSNISSASNDAEQRLTEIVRQLETAQTEKRLLLQAHMRQTVILEELRAEKQKRMELEESLKEETNSQDGDAGLVRLRQDKRHQSRPLTRYLPVRNGEIDLPEFLEQCGHNFELCSHISISSKSARGWLTKMGGRIKTWHRRWFVFDRLRRHLVYFADKTEVKRKGCIPFEAIDDVFIDHLGHVKSPNPKLTFCVKTKTRTYYVVAPSTESRQIWIDVMFTGAEGYQEFD